MNNNNKIVPSTRHRILITKINETSIVKKNMIVRTMPNSWVNTTETVVIPLSVHSDIHDDADGFFKIGSLINVIKSKVNAKVIVLFCEGAHLNVISINHQNNIKKTLQLCRQDAEEIYQKYKKMITCCDVVYWQDFVMSDRNYEPFKNQIYSHIISSEQFTKMIFSELENGYTGKLLKNYPDTSLYMERALLDHIEMTVGIKIMYEKKCRFLCYPGKVPNSIMSFQHHFYPDLTFVNIGFKSDSVDIQFLNRTGCNE